MTDPQQYVAQGIEQHAEQVAAADPGQALPDPGEAQAQAGIGVTESDLEAIWAQLNSFKAQLAAAQAAQAQTTSDSVSGSVATLVHYLEGHGDPAAMELGKDATEAAKAVAEGGNTGALSGIVAKIEKHLRKHAPYPGENFHYKAALATVEDLPDVIDRYQPPSTAPAVGSDRAPAKVVAGSVVG